MISGWKTKYSEILKEFGYEEKKDKESATILNTILKKSKTEEKIRKLVQGNTVFVIGSGPSLSYAIPKLKNL
ncbi:6-hydroxymethyl-78-dihydropterin pyrophosphokinase protein, partial [Marine Group I thaumarchaeote SCGC AAA799-D11]